MVLISMNYGTFIVYLHLSAGDSGENVETSRNEAFGNLKSETSNNYEGYDNLFTHANKSDHSQRFDQNTELTSVH